MRKIILISILSLLHINGDSDVKRLLLNDQDVINSRINQLESLVNQVVAENKQVKRDLQNQKLIIQQLETNLQNTKGHGAMFIRWGRKQCPDNTSELVYSGFAGGGHFNEKGAGVNYECLPPDPDYVKTSGNDGGRMYGAEFDGNFFASNSKGEDVPCALCRSEITTSSIMIPGKNQCYNGWKMEYHGYLASSYYDHPGGKTYACVDIQPEYIMGGVNTHYGALFYEVITKCGSLKCPPYVNNYPLTCVVCSK